MPPAAAAIDSAAMRGFRSSPNTSSRLSSNATTKKNSVIKASLIQARNERAASSEPIRMPTGSSQKVRNGSAHGELDRARAAMVTTRRIAPPAASMRTNDANGLASQSTSSPGSRSSPVSARRS